MFVSAPSPTDCPDEDALLAYVGGVLPPAEAARVEAHLDSCDACCTLLAEAGRALTASVHRSEHSEHSARSSQSAPGGARTLPQPGDKVGRYHLMEVLGRGAMGVVYAAYDPELDRRVAVKLVRVQAHLGADVAELEARLLGEAQAMARLTHRNVVAVYDIGTVAAGIYIAMELVVGQTLRGWLEGAQRSWREIVAAFLQAGDGLAAAHAAEIVHRDFKPDNVLVDATGRVLVTDFGLARVTMRDLGTMPASVPSSDLRRTRAGTIIGTPAYMAPEQLDGGHPVDARADIFAFGASLYEALYKVRPYPATTFEELEQRLKRGIPTDPPPSQVPTWVRRVVMRALAGDPAARFPSMAALTQALRADPRKKLLRVALPALALVLVAGGVGLSWHLTTAPMRACRAGAGRVDAVWPAERQEAARTAFAKTGSLFAPEVFALASDALTRHLDEWRAARIEACDATHDRGEQSDDLLDLRLRCLDQRLAEADALVAVFTTADAQTVERAPEAVGRLPNIAICAEVDRLRSRVPMPVDPIAAQKVEAATAEIARAEAAELTGRWDIGTAHARRALELAQEAGHRPTAAEATLVLADLRWSAAGQVEAPRLFEEAIALGLEAGDDRIAAQAALGLSKTIAYSTRVAGDALRWTAIAAAESARLGEERELAIAVRLSRAEAYFMALESAKALADLELAASLSEGTEDPLRARTLARLASAYQQVEKYAEAIRTFEQALQLTERTLGPGHPATLALAVSFGACLTSAGQHGPADQRLAAVQGQLDELYPANHPDLATVRHTRATALAGLGRYDEAETLFREGIAIERKAYADNPGQLALSYSLLAQAQLRSGRGSAALESLTVAREMNEKHLGNNPVMVSIIALLRVLALEAEGRFDDTAVALTELETSVRKDVSGTELAMTRDAQGRNLVRAGRAADGVARHEQSLAILEPLYGKHNLELTPTLASLGQALFAAGRTTDARQAFERAIAILTSQPSDPLLLAEVRFDLAKALTPIDPPRARRSSSRRPPPMPRHRPIRARPASPRRSRPGSDCWTRSRSNDEARREAGQRGPTGPAPTCEGRGLVRASSAQTLAVVDHGEPAGLDARLDLETVVDGAEPAGLDARLDLEAVVDGAEPTGLDARPDLEAVVDGGEPTGLDARLDLETVVDRAEPAGLDARLDLETVVDRAEPTRLDARLHFQHVHSSVFGDHPSVASGGHGTAGASQARSK